MRPIVPIPQLNRRVPEAGRLRFGEKSGKKGAPKAIDTWRATSSDRDAIEALAEVYGGTPEPWNEPKAGHGQWQVKTEANEFRVVLPPDPLSQHYELWSGGGCQRRCDGETCEQWQNGPDGPEPYEVPCVCWAKQERACKPKTRLSVILPDVRFTGVWRLDTGSWNAAQELPGMVDLVQSVTDRGLTHAILRLEHRKTTSGGQTKRFIIPVLGLPASIEQLAAGHARVGSLPSAAPVEAPAIGPGREAVDPPSPVVPDRDHPGNGTDLIEAEMDEDVTDAVLMVSDDQWAELKTFAAHGDAIKSYAAEQMIPMARDSMSADEADQLLTFARQLADDAASTDAVTPSPRKEAEQESETDDGAAPSGDGLGAGGEGASPDEGASPTADLAKLKRRHRALCSEHGISDDDRRHVIAAVTGGRTESSTECDEDEMAGVCDALEDIGKGRMELHLRANGAWDVRRKGAA